MFVVSLLFILFTTAAILFLLWRSKYGRLESKIDFFTYDVFIRTKIPEWRSFLVFVNFHQVNSLILKFFHAHRKYNIPTLLRNIEIVFVKQIKADDSTKELESTSKRIFCWDELKYKYAIIINLQACYKKKINSENFAELLIHEFKHIWINYTYKQHDHNHLKPEWLDR